MELTIVVALSFLFAIGAVLLLPVFERAAAWVKKTAAELTTKNGVAKRAKMC